MRIHQQSTRFRIVSKSNGGSAVESASYISRQKLTSEVTGETHYPKHHEDLVYSGILLPENAPTVYQDRATLWNSVEKNEKSKKAQLARTMKADLPNDWSYELAEQFLKEFVQKTFVNKGMCADIAIHDSVNPEGQRNLHSHIMLTLRPIIENGAWGAKSKKNISLTKRVTASRPETAITSQGRLTLWTGTGGQRRRNGGRRLRMLSMISTKCMGLM